MKRIISVLLCLLAVVTISLSTVAMAVDHTTTSLGNGFVNVQFDNGYRGFCLDRDKHDAVQGAVFAAVDTSAAISNTDNSDLSQPLKILFTQCFEDIFTPDGNGGYVISSINANTVQLVVYHFTEGQPIWGDQKKLVNTIEAYAGPSIPDHGYTLTLDNGDVIKFDFMVLQPEDTNTQDFFAFKITVSKAEEHQHQFSEEWYSDGEHHWRECTGEGCDEKTDVGAHIPTVVNQKEAEEFKEGYTGDTICSVCKKAIKQGVTIPATHEHEFSEEWFNDWQGHWCECVSENCDEKTDVEEHTPTVVDQKEAGEFEEGYTGDTVCEICKWELIKGTPIPATHEHQFSEVWQSDGEWHWRECVSENCDEKTDVEEHTPTVVNQKEAGEFEEGYTGDTVCEICKRELIKGTPIPATHEHQFSEVWQSDGEWHWRECVSENCDEKTDVGAHIPTVVNQKEAGEFEEGYTGDTVCEICKREIKKGEPIPAISEKPSDIPPTGDSANLSMWILIAFGSLTFCVFMIMLRTRKIYRKR